MNNCISIDKVVSGGTHIGCIVLYSSLLYLYLYYRYNFCPPINENDLWDFSMNIITFMVIIINWEQNTLVWREALFDVMSLEYI